MVCFLVFGRNELTEKSMSQPSFAFRLAVWKPANLARRLMVYSADQTHMQCMFHEQVYSWETEEDIWGSLVDVDQTRKVKSALIDAFDPSRSPEERSFVRLKEALDRLREVLSKADATAWSECYKTVKAQGYDEINLRANTVLLLYRHLEWIWHIFKDVPGASVTAR